MKSFFAARTIVGRGSVKKNTEKELSAENEVLIFKETLEMHGANIYLSELTDQNNTVNSSSSGNNRKNVQKNLS
jgi:hypothetical protein